MAAKALMRRRREFADVFNVLFRRAGLVIDTESLMERNTEMVVPLGQRRRFRWLRRVNDWVYEGIVGRIGKTDCVLLCLENQAAVSLDMPLRNLITSGLRWDLCRERLEERNLAEGRLKDDAECLSGLRRGELLPPVVVAALYLGKEPWSGPMRLQEMVDTPLPELRPFMADCPANVVSLVDLAEETVWGMRSPLRPLSWLLRTQDDDVEMLRRAREDPLFLDAPSLLYRVFNELTGADLSVPRKKEHNNMCLAIEKMKEKGRLEERKKALKAIEEEQEKAAKALEEEQEKAAKALEEEQEKAAKALYDERKNGIFNLIATCRHFGISLEMACRQLMKCYHLTQSEAAAYLKEYYV